MVAFPVASPASNPEEFAVMVRVSDDVQAKSVVTSLVEPSLKVAMAFNWVVLPMATDACAGTTATKANSAALPATVVFAGAIGFVPLTAERTFAAGCLIAGEAAV